MARHDLLDEVLPMDVWDTHTHLVGGALAARSFWDIAHYFWFLREMQASGYPTKPEDVPEAKRVEAFLSAFRATRNTAMNWVVRGIFRDLYHLEIHNAASIEAADRAVRASAERHGWPGEVAGRIGVRRTVVNVERDAGFPDAPGLSALLPRLEGPISRWMKFIADAEDARAAALVVAEEVGDFLADVARDGCRGVMTSNGPFGRLRKPVGSTPPELAASVNDRDDLSACVLHALCRAAEEQGLFVQLFLGVESGWGVNGVPANDPDRILMLYGLFQRYACPFELVLASDVNNLDAVHAATIFPNVRVGGMWWYNFKPSTYRASMQMRLESLPPGKSAIIASDARCIEWCYGKVLLVKHLLAEFLQGQIARGWLDRADALRVAREWLHDSAAGLYR